MPRSPDRRRLRALVWEISDGRCEWPGCSMPAVEMAHIRSIGMGGKNIASDRIGNVMAACQRHARHSDLLPGDGETLNEMRASIEKVIDVPATAANVAWELVEALTKAVAAGRSAFQLDEGDDDDV